MSKSRRKTPKFGHCGGSEKMDKRFANRRLRKLVRKGLRLSQQLDQFISPLIEDVSNVWNFQKDGKFYWPDCPPEFLRK